MALQKIDTYPFSVAPFDDDFTGHLSWGVLGKHILSCAERHAGARQFDSMQSNGHQYLWVLSRMIIEMEQWPYLDEEYSIATWIRRYYYYFTDRCFDVMNAQQQVIGRVFTIWAMIDGTTREPQMLQELFGKTFDPYIDLERPYSAPSFSRIKQQSEQPIATREPHYSDIDQNGHVNSIRYIEYLLDLFPKERFAAQQVSRMEITYNCETYADEMLSFYIDPLSANDYHVTIRKNVGSEQHPKGQVVCHSALTFSNRTS